MRLGPAVPPRSRAAGQIPRFNRRDEGRVYRLPNVHDQHFRLARCLCRGNWRHWCQPHVLMFSGAAASAGAHERALPGTDRSLANAADPAVGGRGLPRYRHARVPSLEGQWRNAAKA